VHHAGSFGVWSSDVYEVDIGDGVHDQSLDAGAGTLRGLAGELSSTRSDGVHWGLKCSYINGSKAGNEAFSPSHDSTTSVLVQHGSAIFRNSSPRLPVRK
jgi:hypothetical protein